MLIVEYCGSELEVSRESTLTFGREADLIIDDNPYLHRTLGELTFEGGRWWLRNRGGKIQIVAVDQMTHARALLPPGTEQVLPGKHVIVRFNAGKTDYELSVHDTADTPAIDVPESSDTMVEGNLPMTESQLLLVLVLSERALQDPQAPLRIPPSKEAAARLGWKVTKFNRKLDNVCDKLTRAGVRGLKSSGGAVTTDRRIRLVEYAVAKRIVSSDDLWRLEPHA